VRRRQLGIDPQRLFRLLGGLLQLSLVPQGISHAGVPGRHARHRLDQGAPLASRSGVVPAFPQQLGQPQACWNVIRPAAQGFPVGCPSLPKSLRRGVLVPKLDQLALPAGSAGRGLELAGEGRLIHQGKYSRGHLVSIPAG
jgi:hypothetical protein